MTWPRCCARSAPIPSRRSAGCSTGRPSRQAREHRRVRVDYDDVSRTRQISLTRESTPFARTVHGRMGPHRRPRCAHGQDEYDNYIGEAHVMLMDKGATAEDMEGYLSSVEDNMGLTQTRDRLDRRQRVA